MNGVVRLTVGEPGAATYPPVRPAPTSLRERRRGGPLTKPTTGCAHRAAGRTAEVQTSHVQASVRSTSRPLSRKEPVTLHDYPATVQLCEKPVSVAIGLVQVDWRPCVGSRDLHGGGTGGRLRWLMSLAPPSRS